MTATKENWFNEFRLGCWYIFASVKRERRNFVIGIVTISLVVGFVTLLHSAVLSTSLVFLRLSEDSVGETDLILTALPANNSLSTLPLVNAKYINEQLIHCNVSKGAAPRWVFMGKISPKGTPEVNTTAIALILDSEAEERIGLGSQWNRRLFEVFYMFCCNGVCLNRPMGEQEAYVSKTALKQLGVRANMGERVVLTIDFFNMLGVFGMGMEQITSAVTSLVGNSTVASSTVANAVGAALGKQ